MTRLIHIADGRAFDTTRMTQAEELAYLRRELGEHYAQFVVRVAYVPTKAAAPGPTGAAEEAGL